MKITSHFVGIETDDSVFKPLYGQLADYIAQNDLSNVIVLQPSTSLHITLYYLPPVLGKGMRENMLEFCNVLTTTVRPAIRPPFHVAYFGGEGTERVCYFAPSEDGVLRELHVALEDRYRDDSVPENALSYTPHITLFRIKDPRVFHDHRAGLERIIGSHIAAMHKAISGEVKLYEVDSTVEPELQTPIT